MVPIPPHLAAGVLRLHLPSFWPETMDEEDLKYFEARAEQEIGLAQVAEHPSAVRAHYTLAGYYLDRVHGRSLAEKPVAPVWR